MKALVIKDFKLPRFMNLIGICTCIIFGYIGISIENILISKLIYIFAVLATSYLTSIVLSQKELETKSDIFINSLPINRYYVVRSKYIFMALYILMLSLIVFLSSNILGFIFPTNTPGIRTSVFDIFFIVGLALIFYSIYLPIYYFSIGKAQIFNQFFYILLILCPSLFNRFSEKVVNSNLFKYFMHLNFNLIISIIAFIGLLLYLISLNVSRKIYEAKEF